MKYYILKIQAQAMHPTVWRIEESRNHVDRLRHNKWGNSIFSHHEFTYDKSEYTEVTKEQVMKWYPKATVL